MYDVDGLQFGSAVGAVTASNDKSSEDFFDFFLAFEAFFGGLSALAHGSSQRSRSGTINFRHLAFAASTP
jgi:hypothetical protein